MLGLFKVDVDYYYGRITSLFIADVDSIRSAYGLTLWLYDRVGKHSEVDLEINEKTFKLISTDLTFIEALKQTFGGKNIIMGDDLSDRINNAKERSVEDGDD